MRSLLRWCTSLLFLLTFPLAAQQTPFSGVIPIPGTIQAENFDNGGQTVSWLDSAPGNAFGNIYRATDVDIGQLTATNYHIGALEAGEWVEYTVNVAATGTYNIAVTYSSGYNGATTFNMVLGSTAVFSGNQSVPWTGSWSTYTTRTYSGTLTAGTHVLRVNFVSGFWNPDSFTFSQASTCVTPVTITLNPVSKSVNAGANVRFDAGATGSPTPTYQWYRNGAAIPGATGASLTRTAVEYAKDAGNYHFTATNSCGTKTSTTATLTVRCDGPEDIMENLKRHIQNDARGDRCDWARDVSTTFPTNFGNGQSYNIPVVAAAVAIVKQPIRASGPAWNMYNWWTTYLQGELGDRPPPAWYYGGQEVGSYDYQAYNVISVLVAHRYANLAGTQGDAAEALAARWLRTTFTLQALSASQQQPLSLHAKTQQFIPTVNYDGPYVGMAGERSPWGFWVDPDRSIMLAEAIGWATNRAGELTQQKVIREHVDDWAGVYPFTATEKTNLRNTIINHTPPPGLAALIGTKLRTQKNYHLVAWPDVKVTLLEQNTHMSTAPTFGVAYFKNPKSASGREAHFLYPWSGLWNFPPPPQEERRHRHQIVTGFAALYPGLMEAWHDDSPPPPDDPTGPPTHPEETVRIDGLPTATPRYKVTLRPDGDPIIQCSPAPCP